MFRDRVSFLIGSIGILVLGVVVLVSGEFGPVKGSPPGAPPVRGDLAVFVGASSVIIGLWGLYQLAQTAPEDDRTEKSEQDDSLTDDGHEHVIHR